MNKERNPIPPGTFVRMNLDADPRMMDAQKGDYREALNMRFFPDGILKTHDGMVEIEWDRPSGNNIPRGYTEARSLPDGHRSAAYILFENSLGNHSIVAVWEDNTATVIFQGPGLEIDGDEGGVEEVFAKALLFASPTHEPKMLDLGRGHDPAKLARLTAYLPTSPDVVDQRTFAGSVLLDGVVQATSAGFYTATPAEVFSFTDMVGQFAAGFQAAFPQFTATGCGSWVDLEAATTGDWTINITWTDVIDTVVQPTRPLLWERVNTYALPLNRWQVNMAKFSPVLPPRLTPVVETRYQGTRLDGHCYQMAHRYVFRDGSESAEGNESEVVPVTSQTCGLTAPANALVYDFSNDIAPFDPNALAEIKAVDIFISIDGGDWMIVRTLQKWEFIYTRKWTFRNESQLIPFQATGGSFPVQPQTYVPQRASALCVAQDPTDPSSHRAVLGGMVEGLPAPCVQASISVAYSPDDPDPSSFFTLELRFRIGDLSRDDGYAISQPVGDYGTGVVFGGMSNGDYVDTSEADQVLPSGGFIIYSAGTPYYGISEQVIIAPNLPCGTISPTIKPGSRNAFDLSQPGSPLSPNPCNRTHRAGCRQFIENGEIYQRVRIQLPSGRQHVIRFASHKCSASGDGSIYDLLRTDLAWQNTSTNVVGIGQLGQPGTAFDTFECIIDVSAGYTGTWDAGWAQVLSLASPPIVPGNPFHAINMVFIDADGDDYSPTDDIRLTGTKAEKQFAYIRAFDGFGQLYPNPSLPNGNQIGPMSLAFPIVAEIAQGQSVTDHNGYCFFQVQADPKWRAAWLSVTGDPLNPTGSIPNWTNGGGFTATNLTIVNGGNQNKWEGDLNSNNALTGPASGDLNFTGRVAQYVVPNLGPTGCRDWIRTWLEGTVEDTLGRPLPNMAVIAQRGHWTTSGTLGTFRIPFYADMFVGSVVGANFNNREEDGTIVFAAGACTVQFPDGGYAGPWLVDNFEAGAAYSDGIPFTLPDFIGTLYNASASLSTFPRGWTGRIGLKLYDAHGRQTPVQPIGGVLDIAWKTQDLNSVDPIAYPPGTMITGRPEISFTITGAVPVSPHVTYISYQLCCTRTSRYSRRLDWLVSSAAYASAYIEGTGFEWTAYGSGAANVLVLLLDEGFKRFRELNQQTALTDQAKDFIELSGPGWSYQKGDRIIFASKTDGTRVFRDVEITGYRDGGLTIDASAIDFEVRGGEEITLWRPAPEADESAGILFYELPLAAYPIDDPCGSPSWSVSTDVIQGGDHWAVPTGIPIRPGNDPDSDPPSVPWSVASLTMYSQSASNLFPSRVPSTGRPWASVPDAKEELQRARERWSQPWTNGSGISAVTTNGLPTFYESDYLDGPATAGRIRALAFNSDVIAAFCDGGMSFSAYTGFVTSQAQGQQLLASSQGFITQVREFASRYGTVNPLSVRRWDTWFFAFDHLAASLFAWSVNGLDPKEVYGIANWLKNEMTKFDGLEPPRVVVGVDGHRDEVWMTVEGRTLPGSPEPEEIGGFTLIFDPKQNRWVSFMGFAPQMYARSHNKLFSILGGRIWLHDADPAHPGRFYGVDQVAAATMVQASPVQMWWNAITFMGMKGTAFLDDGDGEPDRVPEQRTSQSRADTPSRDGYEATRGIPPDPVFGRLGGYALTIRLVGDPGQPHRILAYQVRGTGRV